MVLALVVEEEILKIDSSRGDLVDDVVNVICSSDLCHDDGEAIVNFKNIKYLKMKFSKRGNKTITNALQNVLRNFKQGAYNVVTTD